MNLKDKVVLVTGSTSGIGLGIVRAFAAKGAHVMLNGLAEPSEIEILRAGLEKEHRVRALYQRANVTDAKETSEMIVRCEKELGRLDILINNAGMQHISPVEDFPMDKLRGILMLGTLAPFGTIQAALPGMKARKWGRIINIASAHALVASPYKSAYVASKHAMAGLTKAVAMETATDGITVNAIAPGYVWTPLVENQIAEIMKLRKMTAEQVKNDVLLSVQPTKRFVTIEEVAAFACFLASEEAASITGAILPIDGGWTAH